MYHVQQFYIIKTKHAYKILLSKRAILLVHLHYTVHTQSSNKIKIILKFSTIKEFAKSFIGSCNLCLYSAFGNNTKRGQHWEVNLGHWIFFPIRPRKTHKAHISPLRISKFHKQPTNLKAHVVFFFSKILFIISTFST